MRIWAFASCSTLVAMAAACTANRPASQDPPKVTSTEEGPTTALDHLDKNEALQSDLTSQIKETVAPPETDILTPRPRVRGSAQETAQLQARLQRLQARSAQSVPLQLRPSFSRPSLAPRATNASPSTSNGLAQAGTSPLQPGISQQGALQAAQPRVPNALLARPAATEPINYAVMPLPRPNLPTPNGSTTNAPAPALAATTEARTTTAQTAPSALTYTGTPGWGNPSTPQPSNNVPPGFAAAQPDGLEPTTEAMPQPAAVSPSASTSAIAAPAPETLPSPHQHLATLNQPLLTTATGTPTLHGSITPQFSAAPSLPGVPVAPIQPEVGEANLSAQPSLDPSIQARLQQLRQARTPDSLPLYEGRGLPNAQSAMPQSVACQLQSPEQLSQISPTTEFSVVKLLEQGKSLFTTQETVPKLFNNAVTCAGGTNELAHKIPEAATAGTPIPGRVESPTRNNPAIGVALPGNTP